MTPTHKKTHSNKEDIPLDKALEGNNSCLDKAGISNKVFQAVVSSSSTLVKWCHGSYMFFVLWSLCRQSTLLLISIILCMLLLCGINNLFFVFSSSLIRFLVLFFCPLTSFYYKLASAVSAAIKFSFLDPCRKQLSPSSPLEPLPVV